MIIVSLVNQTIAKFLQAHFLEDALIGGLFVFHQEHTTLRALAQPTLNL